MLINTAADAVVDIHIRRRTSPTGPKMRGSGGQDAFPTGALTRVPDPYLPCLTSCMTGTL